MNLDFWICAEFATFVWADLVAYAWCFDHNVYRHVPNSKGEEKMRAEWPNLMTEFGLDSGDAEVD